MTHEPTVQRQLAHTPRRHGIYTRQSDALMLSTLELGTLWSVFEAPTRCWIVFGNYLHRIFGERS